MKEGTLTKFAHKAKMWISPKHPLFDMDDTLKKYYCAAMFTQAGLNPKVNTLNNYELERLMSIGLSMSRETMSEVIRIARNQGAMVEYLVEHLQDSTMRCLFLLDLINVSTTQEPMTEEESSSINLFGKVLGVDKECVALLFSFMKAASTEEEAKCYLILEEIQRQGIALSMMELKYYLPEMEYVTVPNNSDLKPGKVCKLMDYCEIHDELVIERGMEVVIDHASVRLFGQIIVNGGTLTIRDSRIVKKSAAHTSCIHVKQPSQVEIIKTHIQCRSQGTFLCQDNGALTMQGCEITNVTRGPGVRFFGQNVQIEDCRFIECYSPNDGGAIRIDGGKGSISGCYFNNCEARRGGGIHTSADISVKRCHFFRCRAEEYGAGIYYNGIIGEQVEQVRCEKCCPKETDITQYLGGRGEFLVKGDCLLKCSTIVDRPVRISEQGTLRMQGGMMYMNFPITCLGILDIKNCRVLAGDLKGQDMIVADRARGMTIHKSEFDGKCQASGIRATGTRVQVSRTVFLNMYGGRAIFDAYAPEITECVFNFCQRGAIHCKGGSVKRCIFVNCRARSGAGIMMSGQRGVVSESTFRRCVSEYAGGAIDKTGGHQIVNCTYEECKPDNVS